jgi:hypothetical protein
VLLRALGGHAGAVGGCVIWSNGRHDSESDLADSDLVVAGGHSQYKVILGMAGPGG